MYNNVFQNLVVAFITVHMQTRFFYFLFLSNAIEEMRETRGEKFCHPILAFHGTEVKNIEPICKTGFRIPGKIILPKFIRVLSLAVMCQAVSYVERC